MASSLASQPQCKLTPWMGMRIMLRPFQCRRRHLQQQQRTVICAVLVLCCLMRLTNGYVTKREEEMTKGTFEMAPGGQRHLEDEEYESHGQESWSQMKPVSMQYFTSQLQQANTYHDVYRIFYGDDHSDEAIDKLLMSYPPAHAHAPYRYRHGSNMMGAPRIGRLPGEQPDLEDISRALRHSKQMATEAECRQPVSELLNIRALAHDASKVFFPECTVVHRCRRVTGCCDETSVCAPKHTSTIRRSFIVGKYMKDTNGKIILAERAVEILTFDNHTECECKPVRRIPTCRPCPHPFAVRRSNTTDCTCDCFADHKTCMRMKKAHRPLTELALRCIKEGRCGPPSCQYGEFLEENIRSGFCPRPDEQDESNSGNDSDPTIVDTSVIRSEVDRRALQ